MQQAVSNHCIDELCLSEEHLKLLRQGKAIDCPVYDYSQHNRSDKILHITPSPVILVEGILLLADPRVRELLDIKVYVEADADERILRRISRDVEERGRDLNGIIKQYLNTVKPMHYLYVEPTRSKADIVIKRHVILSAVDHNISLGTRGLYIKVMHGFHCI